MKILTKKMLLLVLTVLFGLCAVTCVALSGTKTASATESFTVAKVEMTRTVYSPISSIYIMEFAPETDADIFDGVEVDGNLKTAYGSAFGSIKHNGVLLSSLSYTAVKYAKNTVKIVLSGSAPADYLFGYDKLVFDASFSLGSYTIAGATTLYTDKYMNYSTTAPASELKPMAVFEAAQSGNVNLAVAFTPKDKVTTRPNDKLFINGVSVCNGNYGWSFYGDHKYDSGIEIDMEQVLFARPIQGDDLNLEEVGGIVYFISGFGDAATTTKPYAFAIEAGISREQTNWQNLPEWKPINGFADLEITFVSGSTYKIALTNTKDIAKTVSEAVSNGGADLIDNFNKGDDMTAFMTRWSSFGKQMKVDGTTLNEIDGVTFEKGEANEILMTLPAAADTITVDAYSVAGNAFISEAAEYEDPCASEHSFGDMIAGVPVTCTTNGVKAHKDCSVCGKHFDANGVEIEDLTIVATGHSFGEWQAEVPATEAAAGTKAHKDCSVCGKHFDADGNEIADISIAKLEPTEKPAEKEGGCGSAVGESGLALFVVSLICAVSVVVVKRKKA